MKTSRIASAVSSIDDDLIAGACKTRTIKRKSWHKGGFLAACFAVLLVSVVAAVSLLFSDSMVSLLPGGSEETYEKGYFYSIDQGPFSSYVGGKVIAEDKIGNKISDVLVTAGWKNAAGEWIHETEKLRGEVYTINGVSNDVAVALKFLDKGEAVTTTHFYVLLNPAADLTPVEAYRIPPVSSDEADDVKLIAEHTDGIASTSLVEATTEE